MTRRELGFLTCLDCGRQDASQVKHLIIPVHKSNDMVLSLRSPTALDLLRGAGCKGGQVSGGGAGGVDVKKTANEIIQEEEAKVVRPYGGGLPQSGVTEFTPRHRRSVQDVQGRGNHPTRDPWYKRSGYRR